MYQIKKHSCDAREYPSEADAMLHVFTFEHANPKLYCWARIVDKASGQRAFIVHITDKNTGAPVGWLK